MRTKTGGRQKGTPNQTTALAREAIQLAFDRLGGVDALVEWVKENDENRKIFYTQIWPKLLPLQRSEAVAAAQDEPDDAGQDEPATPENSQRELKG